LYSNRSLDKIISSTKVQISKENILYENERTYDEVKEIKSTYADLISVLLGDLDYDVVINNMTILKENYNYKMFDFSVIPQGEYTKTYEYDSSGNIAKVIFKS
jgi:ferredoxin-fold anticodon binding domain-containing protein